MCGDCYSMTPKEAETYYASLDIGRADKRPHMTTSMTGPRADVLVRLMDELAFGAYDDAPAFKHDLQALVDRKPTNMRDVEIGIVELRRKHHRRMLTDAEVDALWARRDALRAAHDAGQPVPPAPPAVVTKNMLGRIREYLSA
jgi:hypothetical protein